MKTITLSLLASTGTAALALCLGCAGCITGDPRINTLPAKVDKVFRAWDSPDSPGAAVVVVSNAVVIYQRGYGCANLEHGIPITPKTVFDVASVAKQFTGLAIAMLIEPGRLSLDDDIRRYLPEVPDFGVPITVRHLLYHMSGLRDWFETLVLSGSDPSDVITTEKILAMVGRQRTLDFPPGEEYSYSNTGYNLLAAIVAKVTHQSFRHWTDANLFQPLGMNHTHFCDDATEIVSNRAAYYVSQDKGDLRQFISQLSAPGSSSLMTTAEDMGKWLMNFDTGRVGGRNAARLMQHPGKLNSGTNVGYGFGLSLGNYHGMTKVYHSGSWAGDSSVTWIPEKRFGVVVLANAPETNPERLCYDIANIYLNYPQPSRSGPAQHRDFRLTEPKAPPLTPEQLVAYVGDYWSEELQVVYHIEKRNGELMMGQRFSGWRKLLPKGQDHFDTEPGPSFPVPLTIVFTRDSASVVNRMKISGGRVRNLQFIRASLPNLKSR